MNEEKQIESQKATLNQLLRQLKQKRVSDRIGALESLARMDHPTVVSEMIRALSDRSPGVRATAAEYLGMHGTKEAIAPLINRLEDSDSEVRMMAAGSLGDLLRGNSPLKLIRMLKDPHELVRIEVAESLGAIGDRRALPALWRAVHDRSPLVRSYIVGAIGELGNKGDIAKLEKHLSHEKSDTSKVGFYQALYKLGRHDVVQPLISTLLKSDDYRVRSAAAHILSEEIADQSNATTILGALQQALRQEQTIAARSSIGSSLKTIKRLILKKKQPRSSKHQFQRA